MRLAHLGVVVEAQRKELLSQLARQEGVSLSGAVRMLLPSTLELQELVHSERRALPKMLNRG